MQLTGAQILIEALIDQGVDTIFGYPGGTVLNIYDALYDKRDKIRHILASHEQGAAHAADGFARSTGKTGVALATSGPGATNLTTGIATAFLDSVPLVVITGNVPLSLIGRDTFQEVDTTGIMNPIVKQSYMVQNVAELEGIVREAFVIANSGRKGPVLIDIPKDITAAKTEYSRLPPFTKRPAPAIKKQDIDKAAEAIRNSRKPLLFAGGGVVFSDSSKTLIELSAKINAPVCVSMMGLSGVPHNYPLYLGMVGMHGTPSANYAVNECDLLIAVGVRFSDRVAGNRQSFAKNATIIHIDIDKSEISKNVEADISVVGNAEEIMGMLIEECEKKNGEWVHSILKYKVHNALPQGINECLNPKHLIEAIKRIIGEDTIIVTDVGQHQMLVAQHYQFAAPRSFISSCGLGTMGFGLGAAIGAKIGNPDRPVVLVTGDGSFHMNMNELAVAVTNNLPIIILVMNNRLLGMVHQWQKLFYDKRYSFTEINRATDFVKLAEAFSAKGCRITRKEEIPKVFEEALNCGRPCVIDCEIDEKERVYPFIPPGGCVKDMIYCD